MMDLENKIFGDDVRYSLSNKECVEIRKDFVNSKILILGGSGSIGSVFLLKFLKMNISFKNIYIVDKDENATTELMRKINNFKVFKNINYICSDIGLFNLKNFIKTYKISHYLNFAALKHVRSEENFFSTKYMLNTNFIYPFRIGNINDLTYLKKVFFISTDKSSDSLSIMGITKRIMEIKLGNLKKRFPKLKVSSVRFANVSFTNGSLLQSAYDKVLKNELIGVPNNIYRYFIKKEEAANLCLKSLLNSADGYVLIPNKKSMKYAYSLLEIIKKIIIYMNFKPKILDGFFKKNSRNRFIKVIKRKIQGQKKLETFKDKNEKETVFDDNINKIQLPSNTSVQKLEGKLIDAKDEKNLRKLLKKITNNKNFHRSINRLKLKDTI